MCLCLEEKVVNRIMVFNSRMIGFVISNLRIINYYPTKGPIRSNYRIYYHSKHIGSRQLILSESDAVSLENRYFSTKIARINRIPIKQRFFFSNNATNMSNVTCETLGEIFPYFLPP